MRSQQIEQDQDFRTRLTEDIMVIDGLLTKRPELKDTIWKLLSNHYKTNVLFETALVQKANKIFQNNELGVPFFIFLISEELSQDILSENDLKNKSFFLEISATFSDDAKREVLLDMKGPTMFSRAEIYNMGADRLLSTLRMVRLDEQSFSMNMDADAYLSFFSDVFHHLEKQLPSYSPKELAETMGFLEQTKHRLEHFIEESKRKMKHLGEHNEQDA